MRKKLFTFLLALAASVGMMNATPTFIVIGTNEDPNHAGVYYTTFFDSSNKYALPNDGTEAYAAEVSGDSPAPAGDMDINTGIPTTDQW